MRTVRIVKYESGKFQVNIDDTFTGDSIMIDSERHNKRAKTLEGYQSLPGVREIINSEKPLYLFSQQ